MRPSPYDVIGAVADIRRGEGRQLMQRYDLVEVTYQVYYTDHEMEKYDEGEWVKYDDVAARIAELEKVPRGPDGGRTGGGDGPRPCESV